MDGSTVDSTALRMRTSLQRLHHARPEETPDGFLEELLKMPTVSESVEKVDSSKSLSTEDSSLDSSPASAAIKPEEKKSDEDSSASADKDQQSDPQPIIPLCYGPAPIPVPQQDASVATPVVDQAEPVTIATEPTVPAATSLQQPVAEKEIEQVVADQPVDAVQPLVPDASPTDESVTPVEPLVQEPTVKVSSDNRRQRDAKAKVETPVHSPQPAVASTDKATPSIQQPQIEAKSDSGNQSAPQEQPQLVSGETVEAPSVTRDARDDSSQREKWYSADNARDTGDLSTSLVERIQAELGQPDDTTHADATAIADVSATSDALSLASDLSNALTDTSITGSADLQQLSGDMAIAAQASAARQQAGDTVTSTGSAGGASLSGRGRENTNLLAVGSTNTTAVRSGAVGNGARSASSSGEHPTEITQQERVRLVQRVARSFSRLGPEGGQVSLKLHPPQLGVLNVSIKIEGQTMTARLQTESSAARDVIVDNLPVLKDRLSEHGIEVEKFQVEVGQQEDFASSYGQGGNSFGGGAESRQGESASSADIDYRRALRGSPSRPLAAPAVSEPRLPNWGLADRSLDVRA
jgi:flagellar hook-length control protein FliK